MVVTTAEYVKPREMGTLMEANDLYGGIYLKVLFSQGTHFFSLTPRTVWEYI